MWYVKAGTAGTAVVIAVMALGAYRDGGWALAMWPLLGGVLVGGGMSYLYNHALQRGKDSKK